MSGRYWDGAVRRVVEVLEWRPGKGRGTRQPSVERLSCGHLYRPSGDVTIASHLAQHRVCEECRAGAVAKLPEVVRG